MQHDHVGVLISARGSVTYAEIEKFMAKRGGILYGCRDKEDIQEAFQVNIRSLFLCRVDMRQLLVYLS